METVARQKKQKNKQGHSSALEKAQRCWLGFSCFFFCHTASGGQGGWANLAGQDVCLDPGSYLALTSTVV